MSSAPARITIADYGMGNLRSVAKAFEHVGATVVVSSDPEELDRAEALVLPGVGAFPEAMREIERREMAGPIRRRAAAGIPLLGVCLGMQLLFESSTEHEGATGLGLLPGTVEPIDPRGLKLPHIGWSPLVVERRSPLIDGIADGETFYFVHSLVPSPEPEALVASADHGERFAAIVARDNIFGTQFHPEKSSRPGLRILTNFTAIAAASKPIPC